jgi:outer membrane protein assembly factor BamB
LDEETGEEVWVYNAGSPVLSSPSIDERQSTVYVATEKGNILALDMRDGLKKWEVKTGNSINTTPSIFGNNIAVGTSAGNMLMLNKFTGQNVWTFNPGFIDNLAGSVSASPVTSGGSLFMASEDGNVYSLNTDQQVGPTSVYSYYLLLIAIVLVALIIGIKKLVINKWKKY